MGQRGRPKTPDVLTPREWEVLDLLRAGLSNREIAARLGISYDGARYHVSEILSKLSVASREEAAEWQPEPQTTRRWSMLPQLPGFMGFRGLIELLGAHKLAAATLPVVALGLAGAGYGASTLIEDTETPQVTLGAVRPASSPCEELFTYQCLNSESATYSSIEEVTAVASFVPALPAYIPRGFEPVSIRHTRPEGTAQFIASESFKQGCPGCDPRMSHNDQIGVYYEDSSGSRVVFLQGFPAYLPYYEHMPDDRRGVVQIGDRQAYWIQGLPGGTSGRQQDYISLYWDLGRVGSGTERLPDGTVLTGSPMSYSITSNSLSVDELVRIAETIDFE